MLELCKNQLKPGNCHKCRHGRKHFNENDDTDVDSTSQRIRVWLELGASDGTGTVEVGQSTTLGVRAVLPGNIGVRIVDCAALDGLGESSQKLLDERGCPVDEQVSHEVKWSILHKLEPLCIISIRVSISLSFELIELKCGRSR